MQVPSIALRLPLFRSTPIQESEPKAIRATLTAEQIDREERARRTERYMRSVGIWESFLHFGGGPTIRR